MANARDKLVADWQHELHAAHDALAAASGPEWVARMRVRLFRFLLACYGKAPWRTTPARHDSQALIFDQPEASFLHGKPAKPAGKIQAVLKAVASAQGPLQSGVAFALDGFVAIASESSSADTLEVFAALKRAGIAARHIVRDGQDVVEVRGCDFHRARWFLSGYEAYATSSRWRIGDCGNELVTSFGVALATAPFIGLLAALIAETTQGWKDEIVAIVFCSVSTAWIVAFMTYQVVRPLWRRVRPLGRQ